MSRSPPSPLQPMKKPKQKSSTSCLMGRPRQAFYMGLIAPISIWLSPLRINRANKFLLLQRPERGSQALSIAARGPRRKPWHKRCARRGIRPVFITAVWMPKIAELSKHGFSKKMASSLWPLSPLVWGSISRISVGWPMRICPNLLSPIIKKLAEAGVMARRLRL